MTKGDTRKGRRDSLPVKGHGDKNRSHGKAKR
jgi:hypothetical protein